MSPKRKRAPGAGRKPNDPSGPGKPFSVRVPEDVLGQLRAKARKNPDGSVSEEMIRLLRSGLDRCNRPRGLRALFLLIETLNRNFEEQPHQKDAPLSWQSDPYFFEAFKAAVTHIMDAARPPGEVVQPPPEPDDPNVYEGSDIIFEDTADEYGRELARRVIEDAEFAQRLVPHFVKGRLKVTSVAGDVVEVLVDDDDAGIYGLAGAARTLLSRGKR
jgi:hypothetical protein